MECHSRRKRYSAGLKRSLKNMRLNIVAFIALAVLVVAGMLLIRSALLKNAYNMGVALAQNYASEEQASLTVYETLLSFGAASIDKQESDGKTREEIAEWMDVYFMRLDMVLGAGAVDPYIVMDGKIIAANPWEGDATYDIYSTEWYQKALAADGQVIFTDVYTDAIYGRPVITAAQKCRGSDTVMAFDILPENIRFQLDSMSLEKGDSFFLCDSMGRIIYKQTDLEASDQTLQQYLNGLIEQFEAGALGSYDDHIIDLDGNQRAAYFTRMDNGWYSIVTIPYFNILNNLNWFTLSCVLIIILFLLVLVGMTWRDMKSNDRIERTNETVRVLGNSYYALYRIDYAQSTYEMIKGSDYVRSRIPPFGKYEDLLRIASEVIEADALKEFEESFSTENIRGLVKQRVRNFGGDFLRQFGDELRWVNVRVLFDESLAPEEVVLCFQEVEEEKQRQLRERSLLEDALAIARRNEEAKQSFFSNMSHDMRTPLNAIVGLSELAGRQAGDPDKVSGYLKKINTASRQLLNLINDILDMSRMEQGKVLLNNKEFYLRECVEECLESFRFQADAEHKVLRLDLPIKDVRLLGDPFRINQILNNLLSNAFKFTNDGDTISVSVTQIDSGEYAKYKLVVADTGIGMTKEFLPHLFEPYSREMRFRARQASGTGLGMSITKSLVTQMSGEISVDSEQGKGTAFTIILPFAAVEGEEGAGGPSADPGDIPKAELNALEGKHILLAEDNVVNMELATEVLSMNGVRVTQAWNGHEAVELFQASEPFTFDAVLMDMQMPELDGCGAARRIRSLSRPDAKRVPVIAVTANAFAEDTAATAAAGMDAHISKPIDFGLLCRTVIRLTDSRGEMCCERDGKQEKNV